MLQVDLDAVRSSLAELEAPAAFDAYVVDEHLRVILSGHEPNDLVPADAMSARLPNDVEDALARVLKCHDFACQPIAAATTAHAVPIRVTKMHGPAGDFYALLTPHA